MEGSAEGNNESNEQRPIGMAFLVFVLLITYLFYRLLVQFLLITNIGVYYDDTTEAAQPSDNNGPSIGRLRNRHDHSHLT